MRSDHLASSVSLGLAKQRYNQPPLDDDFDDMDMAIGVVDVDEEVGIAREHVNNFSNKNLIAAAHLESINHTRGSVAKDRNFQGSVAGGTSQKNHGSVVHNSFQN